MTSERILRRKKPIKVTAEDFEMLKKFAQLDKQGLDPQPQPKPKRKKRRNHSPNANDLLRHRGHEIEIVSYGRPAVNVAIECVDCCEVIYSIDL